MQESLFEIKIIPSNSEEEAKTWLQNYSNLIPLKYAKFLDTSQENLNSSGKIKFSDCFYRSTVAMVFC
jgi:hypothetical protein